MNGSERIAENAAAQARIGLGTLVTRLLDEHWPNSGVNAWYLADLLREHGVRVTTGAAADDQAIA